MIEISDEFMIATVGGQIVATARWSWHAAADGHGAWIAPQAPAQPLDKITRITNRRERSNDRLTSSCRSDLPVLDA